MPKPQILVTGKNGQLGWEIMQLADEYSQYDFIFPDKTELDLSNPSSIKEAVQKYQPDYFINCGAYTAVDKAETEQDLAYQVNALAPGIIAEACNKIGAVLITISTDYVFNGKGTKPYKPDEATDPVNYYGYSKQVGEQLALMNNASTIVIRTSWVYSTHGNNFVKTMLRLMKERDSLNVVADQIGSPTYAFDLAKAILQIVNDVKNGNRHFGLFHFSNIGVTNWYDFAKAIRDEADLSCAINPIASSEYPTPAKRPAYSVMDTAKIQDLYGIVIRSWRTALNECVGKMKA